MDRLISNTHGIKEHVNWSGHATTNPRTAQRAVMSPFKHTSDRGAKQPYGAPPAKSRAALTPWFVHEVNQPVPARRPSTRVPPWCGLTLGYPHELPSAQPPYPAPPARSVDLALTSLSAPSHPRPRLPPPSLFRLTLTSLPLTTTNCRPLPPRQ